MSAAKTSFQSSPITKAAYKDVSSDLRRIWSFNLSCNCELSHNGTKCGTLVSIKLSMACEIWFEFSSSRRPFSFSHCPRCCSMSSRLRLDITRLVLEWRFVDCVINSRSWGRLVSHSSTASTMKVNFWHIWILRHVKRSSMECRLYRGLRIAVSLQDRRWRSNDGRWTASRYSKPRGSELVLLRRESLP